MGSPLDITLYDKCLKWLAPRIHARLFEASVNKFIGQLKAVNINPNINIYNTLIDGFGRKVTISCSHWALPLIHL